MVGRKEDKEKRAVELVRAHRKLKKTEKHISFQNKEKEKRAAELIIANKELAFQNKEKGKRAAELIITNSKLKKTQKNLQEYILGLEKMMFMTSHKIRQPIAHILGISNLLDESINSLEELKKFVSYLKQSALTLDVFTKELTVFMSGLARERKK
jgi:signal transduction histidine kinase